MHSFVTYTLLASASLVAAIDPRFEFPDTVPALLKRQAPGTPQYACHEDCGLLITLGRTEGYCDSDEWNERYGRCMICANTYNIWQYYRNGVTSAAEKCDLSPTPSPSGSEGPASTTQQEPSSTAAAQPSTTQAQDPVTTEADEEEEQTTGASQPSSTGAAEETDDSTPEATTTGAAPEETEDSSETTKASETGAASEETSGTSRPSAATTLTTAATPAESTDAASAGTKTSVGEIGTIGVTGTPAPTTVVVNAGAKHFGLATAVTVAALAMLGLY
ncbi:hypothetical protein N0V84_000157 [Fusarium piperis]|uniref:Cell wall protein n=1 Tax=Fusarium piperis TaxID=1435070 RepID=A0A9W8WN32_9HYPO|nr:hypothetical protein N0V84_000157 [Fusarium piperis]